MKIRKHPSPKLGPAGLVVYLSRGQLFWRNVSWLVGGQSKVNRMCQVESVDLIRWEAQGSIHSKRNTKNRDVERVKKAMRTTWMAEGRACLGQSDMIWERFWSGLEIARSLSRVQVRVLRRRGRRQGSSSSSNGSDLESSQGVRGGDGGAEVEGVVNKGV